jgi:hypothetical protein
MPLPAPKETAEALVLCHAPCVGDLALQAVARKAMSNAPVEMFMIILAASALGAATGWAFFHSVLGEATVIAATEAPPPATPAPAAKAVPNESAREAR